MNRELSNSLPWLTTSGNRILSAATGTPVTLRGVNRSGLEYAGPDEQGFLSGAAISRMEIEVIVRQWRCNIIRLPFNQDFVLRGRNGRSGEEYQRALDQVIFWASSFGAYTLLDLQWLNADQIYGGGGNHVAPLPNFESIELWTTLAQRYKEEPAVLFDLFNEPHDRLNDDPFPLNREDGSTYPDSQRKVTMNECLCRRTSCRLGFVSDLSGTAGFVPANQWPNVIGTRASLKSRSFHFPDDPGHRMPGVNEKCRAGRHFRGAEAEWVELDAHAEFAGLLISGVGVEIIGSAALELVADAELATDVDAESGDGHTGREPAEHPDRPALFLIFNGWE